MRETVRRDVSDGWCWWCPQCKTRNTIRLDSFFHKSRITLQQWMILIYLWVRQYPVTDAADEVDVHRATAIDVYQWLREVCSTKLIQTPIVLGGTVHAVQIDESLFRHKPKVNRISKHCSKFNINYNSTTEVGQPRKNSGYLGSVIHPNNQP